MLDWLRSLGLVEWFRAEQALILTRAFVTLVAGMVIARVVASSVGKFMANRATRQVSTIARRITLYVLVVLVAASVVHQLGFKLGVLLGAAGVLTVAVGFAAQTSASNLISGFFLIAEGPFALGDVIRVSDVTGEVHAIDLLSVKLRTFDNLYVRVPNEELIKSRITNLTHFPLRRNDIQLGVAYKEDLSKVRDVLFEVADRNPLCLDEPAPLFIIKKFGDSALEFQFSVWALRENYLNLNNSIQIEIKQAFDEHGIEIPFPHRTFFTGGETEPFPIRVVDR